MPWRHRNDQALAFACDHTVQSPAHDAQMLALQHLWPDISGEIVEIARCAAMRFELREPQFKAELFVKDVLWDLGHVVA
jgi:hypothetical protein